MWGLFCSSLDTVVASGMYSVLVLLCTGLLLEGVFYGEHIKHRLPLVVVSYSWPMAVRDLYYRILCHRIPSPVCRCLSV